MSSLSLFFLGFDSQSPGFSMDCGPPHFWPLDISLIYCKTFPFRFWALSATVLSCVTPDLLPSVISLKYCRGFKCLTSWYKAFSASAAILHPNSDLAKAVQTVSIVCRVVSSRPGMPARSWM